MQIEKWPETAIFKVSTPADAIIETGNGAYELACALCTQRREKRLCPAIGRRICTICCGEQREVKLDCPEDCAYLAQAHQHEKPRTPAELASEEVFDTIEIPQSYFHGFEPLVGGILFSVAKVASADRSWHDRDVIDALIGIGRDFQRRAGSGLIIEESAAGPLQQKLAAEIERSIAEYRQVQTEHIGYAKLSDMDTLRALVVIVRTALIRTNGRPRARRFLHGLYDQFPGARENAGGIIAP